MRPAAKKDVDALEKCLQAEESHQTAGEPAHDPKSTDWEFEYRNLRLLAQITDTSFCAVLAEIPQRVEIPSQAMSCHTTAEGFLVPHLIQGFHGPLLLQRAAIESADVYHPCWTLHNWPKTTVRMP